MTADELLIARFPAVLTAGLPVPRPDGTVEADAELLHQLCTADGLLEILDWSRQGLAVDPLACMWLASLRWYRLVTGSYPAAAPQPPERELDAALAALLRTGTLEITPGTGEASLQGLASGEMAYPSAPSQPHLEDSAALLRLVPIGLVPYIDTAMRNTWVEQNLALTHGHPGLLEQGRQLVTQVHADAIAPTSDNDGETARVDEPQQSPLLPVVMQLAQRWQQATRAA